MSCQVFVGCMMSGKSIANITESTRWVDVIGGKGLYISSNIDTRDPINIVSSNSSSYKGLSDKFDIIQVSHLLEVKEKVNIDTYDILSIDEINFFDDLEEFVKFLLSKGKFVICSGLDTNWLGEDFGQVKELLKISTEFTKLHAKCAWCVKDMSHRNVKLVPNACRTGKISGSNEKIEVGGKDKYIPLCLEHHYEHLRNLHHIDPFTLKSII